MRLGRIRRLAWAVALAATPVADAAEVATLAVQEPRAFGHAVGDLVTRTVTIDLPVGGEFDETSLPQSARRGQALELRQVTQRSYRQWGWQSGGQSGGQSSGQSDWQWLGRRHELRLVYQVFLSPPEVRTLELPPLTLRVKTPARVEELRVDAWPLTVAPLAPAEAPVREGLGELRPDVDPPLIGTAAAHARLWSYGALLLLLAAYLVHVYLGLPWWGRRQRPFTQAWRACRNMGRLPEAAPAELPLLFRHLHEALNRTAGRVVFEPELDRFIAAHPQFGGLRAELALFFQHSREQFFAAAAPGKADTGPWLRRFCKACCDAERGAA